MEQRRELVSEREWQMYCDILTLAGEVIRRWTQSTIPPSVADVVRVLELAARMGRLSAGLPVDGADGGAVKVAPTINIDLREALERVYGPGVVVDVEEVK